jgi:hypothetical protein
VEKKLTPVGQLIFTFRFFFPKLGKKVENNRRPLLLITIKYYKQCLRVKSLAMHVFFLSLLLTNQTWKLIVFYHRSKPKRKTPSFLFFSYYKRQFIL